IVHWVGFPKLLPFQLLACSSCIASSRNFKILNCKCTSLMLRWKEHYSLSSIFVMSLTFGPQGHYGASSLFAMFLTKSVGHHSHSQVHSLALIQRTEDA